MFDRTVIDAGIRFPERIEIRRATTADDLRLHDEIEDRIRSRLFASFAIDNVVKGRVVVHRDPSTLKATVHLCFAINGRDCHAAIEVPSDVVLTGDGPRAFVEALYEAAAREIAAQFIISADVASSLCAPPAARSEET